MIWNIWICMCIEHFLQLVCRVCKGKIQVTYYYKIIILILLQINKGLNIGIFF